MWNPLLDIAKKNLKVFICRQEVPFVALGHTQSTNDACPWVYSVSAIGCCFLIPKPRNDKLCTFIQINWVVQLYKSHYRVYLKKWYIQHNFLRILDRNCTFNTIYPKRGIISEYSEIYLISFGYLHPEIQSFKKEMWKTLWSHLQHSYSILAIDESIHPHSLEWWNVDQLDFHLFFKGLYLWMDAGHRMRWGKKNCI